LVFALFIFVGEGWGSVRGGGVVSLGTFELVEMRCLVDGERLGKAQTMYDAKDRV
jgi:hypothetical protein